MKRAILIAAVAALAAPALAGGTEHKNPAGFDKVFAEMFKSAEGEWADRLKQDETMVTCTTWRNQPPQEEVQKIEAREKANVVYPPDGNVMGDWKKGEKLAQSGKGGQFSDGPGTDRGGNCYACHQLAKSEVSYGTIGPSLTNYGKERKFDPEAAKAAYAKIYNAQGVLACSLMPRFGHNKFLTIDQIKDATAYLMSPESPVNK